MSVRVVKPGMLTTLQDRGRIGYQRFGVVVGGAMDDWSHRAANALVGNRQDEATLEITAVGPSLIFNEITLIAICGGDLSPRIGGEPVPQGRPVLVNAGSQLEFGARQSGFRVYLAVHGGFDVKPTMHSRSTYLRGVFGGLNGRALRAGDEIHIGNGDAEGCYPALTQRLDRAKPTFAAAPQAFVSSSANDALETVRIVRGEQWRAFVEKSQTAFISDDFTIGTQSDRMGYRIEGVTLKLRQPLEMLSEAVGFGTVQVPPDGNPIVLMADRQTTGGYPKIAHVASVDLPLLAQMSPRQRLRFHPIALDESQKLYLAREQALQDLIKSVVAWSGV